MSCHVSTATCHAGQQQVVGARRPGQLGSAPPYRTAACPQWLRSSGTEWRPALLCILCLSTLKLILCLSTLKPILCLSTLKLMQAP